MPSPTTRLAVLLVSGLGVVTPAVSLPRLSLEPQRIERIDPACRPAAAPCAHVTLSGLRVRDPVGRVALAIQDQLDRALAGEEGERESPRALADSFIAEFLRARAQTGGPGTWFLERRLRLLSRRPRLLSFVVESQRFTGGAHPTQDVRFLNLSPQTGAPTSLDDLLVPGGAVRLTAIARQEVRRNRVVRTARDGDDAESTPDRELGLPASVGVTDDALVLCYDSYEIAPYAAGPVRIEIKLANIRALLRADGPLGSGRPAGPAGSTGR
ncbi:MAG: RsiV family protein [Acidobacteriota bacterium]